MITAILNQKGGSGKTTTAVNLGSGLQKAEKKVLVIDIDPQAHLTYSLGINAHELTKTIYDLLKSEIDLSSCLINRKGLHIIPSNLELAGAEISLSNEPGRDFLLKKALKQQGEQYDFIFIDCPPSLGILTLNALTAADSILIPIQTEFLALQGVSTLLKTVDIVKDRLNENLEILGVLGVRFDTRKVLNQQVMQAIKEQFGHKVFETVIRENIALAEAPTRGQSIFEYDKRSKGSEDYLSLSNEILNRI